MGNKKLHFHYKIGHSCNNMHFCRCEWESEKKRIVKQSMSVLVMMVIVMFEYFAASQTTKISGGCWFSFELIRLSNLNRFLHYSKDWMKKVSNWKGMKFHLQLKPFCLWKKTEDRLDLNAIRLLHPLAYADNWCWSLWLLKNTFSSLKLHSHTST